MLGAMARIAQARGDGVHCPSTARHAAFNDLVFPKFRTSKNCDGVSWPHAVTQFAKKMF